MSARRDCTEANMTLVRRFLKGLSYFLVGVLVLVAVIWFLARPQGELRIAIDAARSEAEAKEIRDRFNSARHRVVSVKEFHNKLGLGEKSVAADPVPPLAGPHSWTLLDFVKLKETSFSFDAQVLKFEGEFNGNNILNAAYGWLGWHDYYLVVKTFAGCTASQHPAVPDASTCREMTATVWPIDRSGASPHGTPRHLEGNLAVYLFKTFLKHSHDSNRTDPSQTLPLTDISKDFTSLDAAAEGLEILERGTSHPRCVTLNAQACRKSAQDLFIQAQTRDPENPYALLGLGLLKMREALTMARGGERIFAVLRVLTETGNYLGAARASTAVREFLDGQRNLAKFGFLDIASFRITSKFIESIPNSSRAYHAFVAAQYARQLDYSTRIEDIPEELVSYLKGVEYEARLVLADSEEDARSLLDELNKLRVQAPDVWIYNITYAAHACRLKLYERARPAIANALNITANNKPLFYDTHVWQANCLVKEEKFAEADAKIAAVVKYLNEIEHDKNIEQDKTFWQRIHTIYIDMGYYFAGVQQHHAAAEYFLKAITRNRCFWPRIVNDRQLEHFRQLKDSAPRPEFAKLREDIVNLPEEIGADCGD
jgi:hypothetical protein